MIDRMLRSPKEQLLLPLAGGPFRAVSPTLLTLIALVTGLASGVAAWRCAYPLALALWLVNRTLDGLDGTVARVNDKQSDAGGYLDIVLDTVVYAAVPLGLALGANTRSGYLCLAVLMISFYVNATSWLYQSGMMEKRRQGAVARGELTSLTIPTGLIEGTETVICYCLFLLFPRALPFLFSGMALLVMVTVGQRLVWAARSL